MELQMSTKTKSEGFERVHIPEEVYDAELKEVKDISEGQYGQRVAFIYKVTAKETVELAYVCYKTIATADNKIGKALMAHGVDLTDSTMDTDKLPEKQVRVFVEDFPYEVEEDGKKVEKVGSTISKVKPLAETKKV